MIACRSGDTLQVNYMAPCRLIRIQGVHGRVQDPGFQEGGSNNYYQKWGWIWEQRFLLLRSFSMKIHILLTEISKQLNGI